MTLRRIDFFTSSHGHQYGVQQAFTKGLRQALERLHIETEEFDYEELSSGAVLAKLHKNLPDCTAGFNVIVHRQSPIEPLGIPHLSIIIDCATYYPELLHAKNAAVSFVEEDSCGLFRWLGSQNVFYLPHAIDRELFSQSNLALCQTTKRDLDLVMCGSYYDADEIVAAWKDLLSPASVQRMFEMAEAVMKSPHRSHLQAFAELVEERGPFERELMAKQIQFFDLMNSLEIYIRSVDRVRLLQALDGYDLHIYSAQKYEAQWKKALKGKKRVYFHSEVPYAEMARILRRSRLVINSMPTIKRGLHERILMALACGASVLSNENLTVSTNFYQRLALVNFLPPNYQKTNELIAQAFANEEKRLADVLSTHETLRENHTWDVRAKTLVETIPSMIKKIRKSASGGIAKFFRRKNKP